MEPPGDAVDHGRLFALTVNQMNVLEPDFWLDPYPVFAELRAEAPVLWHDDCELWTVACHDDVMRISRDPTTFCSGKGVLPSDRERGAITGAESILFLDPPDTIQNAGSLLLSDGSGADRGFREPDRGQYDKPEEVFGACGASVLYRREMLEDVGSFDETFFMYYEDTDLNWRMRLRGWKVMYEPSAVVDHVHAGSSREWSPFFIFCVDRNRLFMLLKNASARTAVRSYGAFARLAADNVRLVVGGRITERRPGSRDEPSRRRRVQRRLERRPIRGDELVAPQPEARASTR